MRTSNSFAMLPEFCIGRNPRSAYEDWYLQSLWHLVLGVHHSDFDKERLWSALVLLGLWPSVHCVVLCVGQRWDLWAVLTWPRCETGRPALFILAMDTLQAMLRWADLRYSLTSLKFLLNIPKLWGDQTIQCPCNWAYPVIPAPPDRNSLHQTKMCCESSYAHRWLEDWNQLSIIMSGVWRNLRKQGWENQRTSSIGHMMQMI